MLKGALFDLDGTLIDTESQYTEFWERIGKIYRPDIPDMSEQIKGTTLKYTLERFFPDIEMQKEVVQELNVWESQMRYHFYPYALDFVKDLVAHDVKCVLVTSSNQLKMANVYKALPEIQELFFKILTSEYFSASKPNPDCFLKGLQVCGCKKNECVVFEDAFNGLQAGMSSEMFTIGLSMSNGRKAIEDKCNYVLDGYQGMTYEKLQSIMY